jgi:hypothetical protein
VVRRALSFLYGGGVEGVTLNPMSDLSTAAHCPPVGPPRNACVDCARRHLHCVQGLLSTAAFLAVSFILTCFLAHLWPWQCLLSSCLSSASIIN